VASDVRSKGVCVLLHGLNGHSSHGSNLSTAHHLLNSGFSVVALDLEGHGRSGGTKGFVPNIEKHFVGDVIALLVRTRQKFPTQPVFLMGSSMGGLTATLTALAVQESGLDLLSGVILQCPLLHLSHPPPPVVSLLITLLARVMPRLPLLPHRAGKGTTASLEKQVRAAMLADPLTYSGRLRAGTAVALNRAAKHASAHLGELRIPFLVQHGDLDPLVALSGSVALAEKAAAGDKKLFVYHNAGHNLLNESSATLQQVRADYLQWMEQRVDSSWLSSGL